MKAQGYGVHIIKLDDYCCPGHTFGGSHTKKVARRYLRHVKKAVDKKEVKEILADCGS